MQTFGGFHLPCASMKIRRIGYGTEYAVHNAGCTLRVRGAGDEGDLAE